MRHHFVLIAILSVGLSLSAGARSESPGLPALEHRPAAASPIGADAYAGMPMAFEPNVGQTDAQVAFLARGRGYSLFLTADEAVLALERSAPAAGPSAAFGADRSHRPGTEGGRAASRSAIVRMKLLDADPAPPVVGLDPLPGVSHYLIGSDPGNWRTHIPNYARVEYRSVYPGVDLRFRGDQRALEFDFVAAPGADLRAIRLAFEGVTDMRVDGDGNLVLSVDGGEIIQRSPVSYQQDAASETVPVRSCYVMRGDCEVGFELEGYDRSKSLVIDPVLVYSTYLGGAGNGEERAAITVDASGNAYLAGETSSEDFPLANPLQAPRGGGLYDAFVAKLNPAGSALVYSTYLGGSGWDSAAGVAVDASGNAYVTGVTTSTDFPTAGPLQAALLGTSDAFVAKLDPTGSALVYSTYLGGGGDEGGSGIAVDASGNAYVMGGTCSTDFPTVNPIQPALAGFCDAFVAKLDPVGSALVYSTYLGGSDYDGGGGIAVDSVGSTYVSGQTNSTDFPTINPLQAAFGGYADAFVSKLDPAGSALVYSTYLGGTDFDVSNGISVDASGNTYITGQTWSTDFPTANPFQAAHAGGYGDAFITKLDPTGSAFVYSTYLGGSAEEWGTDIAADVSGNTYVIGQTGSGDFPQINPLQAAYGGGYSDAFVAKLNPAGSALVYSTYLGGSDTDGGSTIVVDDSGNAYFTGFTWSPDFPTNNPFQAALAGFEDAFVAKLNPDGSALIYSTYLGGSNGEDTGLAIAVDGSGSAYVTGVTPSADFPTMNPAQPSSGGGYDAFVSKLSPDGSALAYSTYIGGAGEDAGTGIAVDSSGSAYVTGNTESTDFPTVNPLQAAYAGGGDAFVAKLSPAGSALVYSTYLGGSETPYGDHAVAIAVDGSGNAYVTGDTWSLDFPTANPVQAALAGFPDAFVAKLNPAGSAFVYSTYIGGYNPDHGCGIAVDGSGNAYVTGYTASLDFPTVNPLQAAFGGYAADAFVSKLNADGSALLYSTYLGGFSEDVGRGIAVDAAGNAYVTGFTQSDNFPTAGAFQPARAGGYDAFVAKVNPAGSALLYSSFLGGASGDEFSLGIAVDSSGNAYVTGRTHSFDFPTARPLQAANAGGSDAFVTKVNPAGSAFVYSTYLGGTNDDIGCGIAVDGSGNAYVTGETISIDFPTLGGIRSIGVGDWDAFVSKISPQTGEDEDEDEDSD